MLTIATFNIRYPEPRDGINFFPHRLPFILDKIRQEQPDIIGFQELMQEPYEKLAGALPEYGFVGTGRGADLGNESNRIAYRTDALELLAWGQFWLSPTPEVPGTRFPIQSVCPRICTWARLRRKDTSRELLAVNTHLDHEQQDARARGLALIFDRVAALTEGEEIPVFITGDFNLTPEEETYRLIGEADYLDLTDGMQPTYHGFGKDTPVKIDYILTNYPVFFSTGRWHQCQDGIYLSDHDPVVCHIQN